MKNGKSAVWSGFWARLLAWMIDAIVLGIVCYGIGCLGIGYFASLGSNGRIVGLVLGILYFGITASRLAGGRSIGMWVCRLKVVSVKGKALSLGAALKRAVLLVVPLILNGWFFNVTDTTLATVLGVAAITAVFGVSLAQIYLLLFNGPTRRLVHDLVFQSVVVKADVKEFEIPKGRAHTIVASLMILGAFALSVVGPSLVKAWMPNVIAVTSPEQRVEDTVNDLPEISETEVNDSTTTFYSTSSAPSRTRTLTVTARVRAWPANVNQELARVGAATVKAYHFAPGQQLTVKIVYGFDLGFGSYSNGESNQFSTHCTTADVKCLAH